MGYVPSDTTPRLYYPEDRGEVVIKLKASLRKRGCLDPYFGAVVRDLMTGLGASVADIERCGIAADGFVSAAEIETRCGQGRLFG